ncbi:MAG: hypothetical protein AB8C84_01025 [Oligoflexales bacterium]
MKTIVFLMSIYSVQAFAVSSFPPHIKNLLKWELESNIRNDPEKRTHRLFSLQHFEIPLQTLEQFDYRPLSKKALESFVMIKRGRKYVRWIINPEDKKYADQLENVLRRLNCDTRRYSYYVGYLTASRSLMIQDPDLGHIFSVKVSTDHTGGLWQNKGVNRVQVQKAVGVTSYLEGILKKISSLPHAIILPEPLGWVFHHQDVEQGMVIRSYDRLDPDYQYPPGFSVIHEQTGVDLAQSHNPHQYWKKHYAGALGTAMAEFIASTGLSYKSAHSQQFLVELDQHSKPTGRIVMRDFNDSVALKPLLNQSDSGQTLLDMWLRKYQENRLYVRFGIFHSSKEKRFLVKNIYKPSWTVSSDSGEFTTKSSSSIKKGRVAWKNHFVQSFEERFSFLTQIDIQELTKSLKTMGGVSTHAVRRYNITSSILSRKPSILWRRHASVMQCLQSRTRSLSYANMNCDIKINHFLGRLYP